MVVKPRRDANQNYKSLRLITTQDINDGAIRQSINHILSQPAQFYVIIFAGEFC